MPKIVRWLVRLFVAMAGTTLIFGIAAYLYGRPDPKLATAEQYSVLSDYISMGLTGESHDLGSRSGLVVVLKRTTVTNLLVSKNRLSEYRMLVTTLPFARHRLGLTSSWPIFSLLVRNIRSEQLEERMTIPAQYALATDAEIANGFPQRFPRNYGYLTFTRAGFNRDLTEAVFYTEHICGLCGEGKYVHMRKIDGKWVIQAESGTWVS